MADTAALSPSDALVLASQMPPGSTLLLLGAPDTGKTTWTLEAARALTGQGKVAAVLDCDLGQSEIGPPGTVGVGLALPGKDLSLRALRDLAPFALSFVGATSPPRHVLRWCAAAAHMARAAHAQRPDVLLVDTCGWVQGPEAVQAKHALAELLLPRAVFAFERGAEAAPLLRAFAHLSSPLVYRVAPAAEAARKTPAARATRRMARFAKAMEQAQEMILPWDQFAFRGTRLGLGEPVPHHVQQFISQTLRARVLHAEQSQGAGLLCVVHGEHWARPGLAILEHHFHTPHILVVPAQNYAGLYLGLVGGAGDLLSVGLLSRLDFSARTITLLTACRRPAAVRQIWMGSLRLRPDGQERGVVRPGEV